MRDSTTLFRETKDVPHLDPLVCPRCFQRGPAVLGRGTVTHYARWQCAACGTYLTWCKWPRDQNGNRLPRPSPLAPTT